MPSHTALPGNAMPTAPLDTRYQIETPEGIDLPLRPAGLMPRALAFGFDLGLRGLILGILFIALAFLGNLGIGLGSILLFLVSWWYMVLFEVLNQGCSPGKQIMGLRVVQDDGTPIGWSASLIRNQVLRRYAVSSASSSSVASSALVRKIKPPLDSVSVTKRWRKASR